jgi:hypothetical protein
LATVALAAFAPGAAGSRPSAGGHVHAAGGLRTLSTSVRWSPQARRSPARGNANSTSYDDAVGDGGIGPDVSKIQIANDDNGLITFTVTFANRPTLQGQDIVNILIDTDLAKEGASPTGRGGYDLIYVADASGWGLLRWNGSSFADTIPFGQSSYSNGVLTFQAQLSDLGNPSELGFTVLTSGEGGIVDDVAPDSILPDAITVYEVKLGSGATPTLKGTLTVGRAKAGTRLNATLVFQRSDADAPTSGPLTGKTIACKATVAGRPLRPIVSQSAGAIVSCAWRLPKGSRGKIAKGSVGVSFASADWAKLTVRFAKTIR